MNKKKTQSKTAKSGANKKKSPSVKELNETINILSQFLLNKHE